MAVVKIFGQKYIFKFKKEIGLPLGLSEQSSGRMAPSTNKQDVIKVVILLIVIILLTRYVYISLAYIILDYFTVSISLKFNFYYKVTIIKNGLKS